MDRTFKLKISAKMDAKIKERLTKVPMNAKIWPIIKFFIVDGKPQPQIEHAIILDGQKPERRFSI